jgi:hypothetical protein
MEAVLKNGYRGVTVTQDEEGRRVDWGNMPWDMLVGVAFKVCCECVSTDVGWRTRNYASNSIVGTGLHCAMFALPHFVMPYSLASLCNALLLRLCCGCDTVWTKWLLQCTYP